MKTKIQVKPVVEYTVTFITGETQNYDSIFDAIKDVENMIKHDSKRIEDFKSEIKRLENNLPVLNEELKQLKTYAKNEGLK